MSGRRKGLRKQGAEAKGNAGVGDVVGGGLGVLLGGRALELPLKSCIQLSMMAHKSQRNLSSLPCYLNAFPQQPS